MVDAVDPAQIARTVELWNKGLSASDVARRLSVEFGNVTSRSAVVGRVRRNGQDVTRKEKSKPLVVTKTRQNIPRVVAPITNALPIPPIPKNAPPPLMVDGRPVGLMDLPQSGACKWPVGDPLAEDFRFCAHPTKTVYCQFHTHLGFDHRASVAARGHRRVEDPESPPSLTAVGRVAV